MNVQLPDIDLSGIVPVIGLVLVVVLIGVFLMARSLLHSRIALWIAVVIGVVAAGPTLANAAVQMVGALVPLAIAVMVSGMTVLWLLNRNPELMALVRDVIPRRPQPDQGEGGRTVVIDQPQQTARRLSAPTAQSATPKRGGDRWGF